MLSMLPTSVLVEEFLLLEKYLEMPPVFVAEVESRDVEDGDVEIPLVTSSL